MESCLHVCAFVPSEGMERVCPAFYTFESCLDVCAFVPAEGKEKVYPAFDTFLENTNTFQSKAKTFVFIMLLVERLKNMENETNDLSHQE